MFTFTAYCSCFSLSIVSFFMTWKPLSLLSSFDQILWFSVPFWVMYFTQLISVNSVRYDRVFHHAYPVELSLTGACNLMSRNGSCELLSKEIRRQLYSCDRKVMCVTSSDKEGLFLFQDFEDSRDSPDIREPRRKRTLLENRVRYYFFEIVFFWHKSFLTCFETIKKKEHTHTCLL